jgi:hypothetical protein
MSWKLRASSCQVFGLALSVAVLSACEIERISQGARLRADPHEWIVNGSTSRGDVLRIFGPPDRIQRQMDGDIFTYSYMRKEGRSFSLEAPRTDLGVSYKKVDEKHDRLVVLFDRGGIVSGYGYRAATDEFPTGLSSLTPLGRSKEPAQPQVVPVPEAVDAAQAEPVQPPVVKAVSASARPAPKKP